MYEFAVWILYISKSGSEYSSVRWRIGLNLFSDEVFCKSSLFPRREWMPTIHGEIKHILHQNS